MTTPGKISIHQKLSINREQIKKKNKLISKFTAHGEGKINSIYKNQTLRERERDKNAYHGAQNSTKTSLVSSKTTSPKLSDVSTTTLDGIAAIFTLVPANN